MKILLINKFLYPKGGDAISTIATGKLLTSKGHKTILWGMAHPLNPDYSYKEYFVSNIDFNNPGGIKQKAKIAINMLYSFEAKRKIEKLIQAVKPDVVHLNNFAHQISPSILHIIKKYDIPTLMTMRDYKLVCPTYSLFLKGEPCEKCKDEKFYECFINRCSKDSFLKSMLNAFEMYLHHKILHIYDLIDIFISPSQFLKDKVERMGFKGKIAHLPNFIDTDQYTPKYDWDDNSIVYFGRLSKEKGLFALIEAIKGLDVKVKIIGEGPIGKNLKSQVTSYKLNNIEFLGYKNEEELKEEIKKSMFMVLPSECYENNPRSIIESFALGKPIVGARIGGIPELVKDNETGLTFDSGNAEDMRLKMECLMNRPDKIMEMGKNARQFVEKELNAEKHYQGLMDIYKQAIERHN